MIKKWIEAMRLRTLPVSVSGVLTGICVATAGGFFSLGPAMLCLLFALSAQITSNFANEYFDFVNGLDRPGREGFRRGVAEGDISARAMGIATLISLGISAAAGLTLVWWGGPKLIPIGILILLAAIAYSGGPWPLSHHGLGDVAVVIFYGIVPVFFSAWLQARASGAGFDIPCGRLIQAPWAVSLYAGAGVGLMGMNVLIVNNYRDMDDDVASGKRTTVVILGRKVMSTVYLASWILGSALLTIPMIPATEWAGYIGASSIVPSAELWKRLKKSRGASLNGLLRKTAQLMLLIVALLLAALIF